MDHLFYLSKFINSKLYRPELKLKILIYKLNHQLLQIHRTRTSDEFRNVTHIRLGIIFTRHNGTGKTISIELY